MRKLNNKQLENIEETLKDKKNGLVRYREVKNDPVKLRAFCVRNRNPIWDITNCSHFKTGLMSESAKKSKEKLVDDHFIQRSKAVKIIYEKIDNNENMSLTEFIDILKRFCSTIKLTLEEHKKVTTFIRKNKNFTNFEAYVACGIKVDGLTEFIYK